MSSFPITPEGLERMRSELQNLKHHERPRISKEIGEARELGDLSENFEYHAAKDRQGLVEAKIRDLEAKIAHAQVIDPKKMSGDRVVFGAIVTIADVDDGSTKKYQILGEYEADVDNGKINVNSPLARALIGKEVGDEVKIPGKGGQRTVEISSITFQ